MSCSDKDSCAFSRQEKANMLVSMYNYVQPTIATIISIVIGLDHLTWKKVLAMVLVFSGVWIVNQSRAAAPSIPQKNM